MIYESYFQRGLIEMIEYIYQNEGIKRGFYKGITINLLKVYIS
jgi:hypothetical protein